MTDSFDSTSMNNITLRRNNNHQAELPPRLIPPLNIKLWHRTRTYSDEVL